MESSERKGEDGFKKSLKICQMKFAEREKKVIFFLCGLSNSKTADS